MTTVGSGERVVGRTADGRGVAIEFGRGKIASIDQADVATDAWLLLPGLVDLQVNGYAGHDLNEEPLRADTVRALTHTLAARGTTTYLPTLITGVPERIDESLRVIAAVCDEDAEVAGAVAGIHLEGPYLSTEPGSSGAHDTALMRDPDVADLDRWQRASGGRVRVITLAPERPGSLEFIAAATARGITCAIGHTDAGADQIRSAVAAGATMSTHLGNGSATRLPRTDNYIWAQLAEPQLTAGLIADGHHLPWYTLHAMLAAKRDMAVLVSDSAALAGSAPGRYPTPVGGDVTVEPDGRLTVTGTDYLAGSGANLLDCLRWAHRATGLDLARTVALSSRHPAKLLGLTDRGTLQQHRRADLLVVDAELEVQHVYRAGRRITT